MREKIGKQSGQKLAAGIFTGVMVLLCVALYFSTANTSPSSAVATSPSPPLPTERPFAAAEDFVEGKSFYAPLSQTDGIFAYSIENAPLSGTLSLCDAEGGVSEFVLRVSCPTAPSAPGENASPLAQRLYQEKLEVYQTQVNWLCNEALSLLVTLNDKGGVTQSDREAFSFALESTISDE